MMTENQQPDSRRDWISWLVKAALIIAPIVAGYFLISSITVEKKQPVGNPNPIARKYGTEVLARVYPGLDAKQIDQLLTETWSRTLAYETFTQFREFTHAGKYVNIDENGFRVVKNQGPWPPARENFNVFVFGGSVTFGYGTRDAETVPSYLQEALARLLGPTVQVYNFARGHYYSVQELILYQSLLLKGFIPDMALFIDGSNDFYYANNKALFTGQFESLSNRMLTPTQPQQADKSPDIYYVAKRYVETKKLIEAVSAVYNIQTVFAWHPIPLYKYDLKYHLFAREGFADTSWSTDAYRHMAAYVKDHPPGNNFIWCADVQEGSREPLYVDRYHYTAKLSSMVADCIAGGMIARDITRHPTRPTTQVNPGSSTSNGNMTQALLSTVR